MTTPLISRLAFTGATLAIVMALAGCNAAIPGPAAPGGSSGAGSSSSGAAGASGAASSPAAAAGSSSGSSKDIDACSLLTVAQATTLVAKYPYSAATPATIAPGQDQCTYTNTGPLPDMVVIVYQDLSFDLVTGASGATTPVSGVGDKAASGDIELDVQAGQRVIAVEAAGGVGYDGSFAGAESVAKAIIAALG